MKFPAVRVAQAGFIAGLFGLSMLTPAEASSSAGSSGGSSAGHAKNSSKSGSKGKKTSRVMGMDVSNWTGDIDWESIADQDGEFAYIHATEGLDYRSPRFATQFNGAGAAGIYRGAYHFAQPHESGGAEQADFFVRNGGRWLEDGRTLPGVLDVEDNPYRNRNKLNHCYGLSQDEMVDWIRDFTKRYRARTHRDVVIYTTTAWWRSCTGDAPGFGHHPLWLASWDKKIGPLPSSWKRHTFWQSAEKGNHAGGEDRFNGTLTQLRRLALPPLTYRVTGRSPRRNGYSITITNTGPRTLPKLSVYGRTYGSNKLLKAPNACRITATVLRCTINPIAPGKALRITLATKPKASGPVGLHLKVGTAKLTVRGAAG